MIAEPLTRRSVVIGGLLGTASLSGCSVAQLTTRKVEDPEAADRARIAQALTLSSELREAIRASPVTDARQSRALTTFAALHDAQIAVFERSAGLSAPHATPVGQHALTITALHQRELDLARAFRGLGLHAVDGQVALLLASAAAGIDQAAAG